MFELDASQGTTNRELRAPELESAPMESVTSAKVSPTPGASPVMHARVIRGWFWRSFAVIAEVAVALVLREAIAHHRPGFAPFITFYPVLLLAALLDGLWAGIAVTALSTLAAAIWVFPPIGKFVVTGPYDVISLGIFFSFGVSLSIVVERYHRNRERLSAYQVEEAVSSERRKREQERKLAESMLAERQRLYDVLETLPTMVSLLRTDHGVAFANRSFREKFGEPDGRRCYEMRHGRTEPCPSCETLLPLQTGQPNHREVSFPDRSVMEAYDFPFKDLDGSSLILEMGLDITERRRVENELKKHREHLEELVAERTRQLESVNGRLEAEIRELEQAQQSLQESQAKLEAALSSMTDSVIITDAEGRFVEFNDAFATLYRFKSKAECTLSFSEFSNIFEVTTTDGELLPQEMYPMWRALRGESVTNVEFNYRRKDTGETWTGSLSFGPIRAEDGTITGSVISARDITEKKRTEETLRQSEKIALQREQFQALAEHLRSVREEERTRVSRDLHDQIGQILTAIKLDLTWMNRRLPKANDELHERLKSTVGLINDGVESVRRICSGLRPGVLDDLGLAAAIEWQANEFAARTGIGCKVSVPAADLALNGDQSTEFFRIFQECLTNVMRHAEAKTVCVSLYEEDGDLVLKVGDDGKGFRESDASGSLGFLGMRERAQVCGGHIEIASALGNGTTVTLRVPMHPACSDGTDYAHSDRR